MLRPTETALKQRARQLVEAMTERARWIYAIPRDEAGKVRPRLEAAGFTCEEEDAGGQVARYVKAGSRAAFVVFDSPVLDVTFVEARGEDTPETLGAVLEDTAFYAQSTLLGVACDVGDPEAPKALRTLAHMVVAWDEDWSDLFLLQLASPDPLIRHEAVTSTSIAAMVAQESAAALVLLREAESHEKYPKLKETLGEAIRLLEAASGSPLTLA
jgi:hypothetical protein